MSVILGRHGVATVCQLGDGTLTDPYFPGSAVRPDNYAYSSTSTVGFENYPTTTTENLTKVIRTNSGGVKAGTIYAGPCGSVAKAYVTAGFPPNPIPGNPFTNDTRAATPYSRIYPRWTGETAWDLQLYPATETFTPQGILNPGVLSYLSPVIGTPALYGVSLDSNALANDPFQGGISRYTLEAYWRIFAYATEVCCWNEGYQIDVNLDIWKVDLTATYQSGTYGYHDFTLGTPTYDSTITRTVTVDSSWSSGVPVTIGADIVLPLYAGYFTFVNDFYISDVRAP